MSTSTTRICAATLGAVLALAGCASDDEAIIGQSEGEEVGEVVLTSDDSTDAVSALCVGDIPEDLTACPGAPANLGRIELDQTLKATLVVPREVALGGYRVRVGGAPPPRLSGVLEEQNQVLQVPPAALAGEGGTVLTVEALRSREHPRAIWQFVLDEPGQQDS